MLRLLRRKHSVETLTETDGALQRMLAAFATAICAYAIHLVMPALHATTL